MIYSLLISLVLFISGDTTEKKIENFLNQKLKEYDKYEFEIVRAPEGEFEFILQENTKLYGGLNYLPVKVKKKSGKYYQTYITIRLKLYKNVYVLKNDIPHRQIVKPDDLIIDLVDLTNLKGTPLNSFEELKGLRSKNKIETGSILTKENFEDKPIVENGDWILASSVYGNVIVEVNAEARQEGIEGDIIKILTKDKKHFSAKIVDTNNVIIVE